jgi:branched-chain amino acid transport system permease protein
MVYGYLGVPDYGRALAAAGGGFLCGYLPGRLMAYILGIQGDYLQNVWSIVGGINTVLKTNALLSVALLLVTLVLGAFAGAVLGLVVSLPILRGVRVFYLAISLLAIQAGFQQICLHWDPILRGEIGVPVPDPFMWVAPYTPPGLTIGNMRGIIFIIASGVVLLITAYYCTSVGKSPLGRLLKAVRDDEKSAEALGRDVNRLFLKAMAVSYAFTGAAGVLFAYYSSFIIGSNFPRDLWTFWPLAMIILGGLANNKGTVVGTIFFITLKRLITFYKADLEPILPFSPVWLDGLLLGLFLILLLIYRPRGLIPEKAELPFSKEKIEEIRKS